MKDNFYKGLADKNKPKDPTIANFEDNSYDDIDWLNKANAPIHKEIEEWKEKQKKTNWLGKWYMQIRIDELKKKLYHYVDKK
jgi:hypothetical protein